MPNKIKRNATWEFAGFASPNTTAVPDQFFDDLMPRLSEAELRCLLYIIRRTFGFKKEADSISFKQLVEGITTRDGRVLDRGTGLSKSAVARGLNGLEAKGVIVTTRNRSAEKGNEPTTYTLRFRDRPLSSKETRGCPPERQALVLQKDTQYTVLQQTAITSNIEREEATQNGGHTSPPRRQRGGEDSGFTAVSAQIKRRMPAPRVSGEDSQIIRSYLRDIARAFHDRATLRASTARATGLWQRSGISLDAFIGRLVEAQALTKESVTSGTAPVRNQMAYFFSVLADVLGLRTGEGAKPRAAAPIQQRTRSPIVLAADDEG